jgi:hypothetical protein
MVKMGFARNPKKLIEPGMVEAKISASDSTTLGILS